VIYSTTVFTTGVWYHVVGTFDGANMTIYVNGSQEATQVMTNQPTTYTATTYIGDYNAGGYPSSSNISSVRLYNRPLSAAEIRQNYQALRGRYGL
jgi:predicted transcriptional regulator